MALTYINEAQPGMILSDDVYSAKGQLLARRQEILSSQMLQHMKFYGVPLLPIQDDPVYAEDPQADLVGIETQSQRIRHSKEYRAFRADYEIRTEFFENSLSDFVKKQEPLECNELLQSAQELFARNTTTIGVLDMLHNMREIDDSTYAHSMNVALISRVMGEWLNFPKEELDTLTLCGLLHDIGKSSIPNHIISKPGKLTDEEYREIQNHPKYGFDLIKRQDIDDHIKLSALMHHERCDGSGYPLQLTMDQLDPYAMIVSIADVYDAMTADRCYRAGICPFDVIADFERNGLKKYHPQYILVFLERIASTYVNSSVILNDGTTGKIVLIHTGALTRPLIQTGVTSFIDLREQLDLYIKAIL